MSSVGRFKVVLEKVLDEQFPKDRCEERSAALLFYSCAVTYYKRYSRQSSARLRAKIKKLAQRNEDLESAIVKTSGTISKLNTELAILKGKDKHYER